MNTSYPFTVESVEIINRGSTIAVAAIKYGELVILNIRIVRERTTGKPVVWFPCTNIGGERKYVLNFSRPLYQAVVSAVLTAYHAAVEREEVGE